MLTMKTLSLLLVLLLPPLPEAGTLPIVLWHGMGDNCCSPTSMGRLKAQLEQATQTYVLSVKIGHTPLQDSLNGFLMPANRQVDMVCKQLAEDPELRDGYNAIGFSQGGQFLRAVAQRCPEPRMRTLVTIGAQHQGVYGVPRCPGHSVELCDALRKMISQLAYLPPIQSGLVQAQYWHDPLNRESYVQSSLFLADINNELADKNASYAENLSRLDHLVMVKFLRDQMVQPKESAHFEFFAPGSSSHILPLEESAMYTEDWIGLRALDRAGRLVRLQIDGDHLQMPWSWFVQNIVHAYLTNSTAS